MNGYSSELTYVPGDHVGILPANQQSIVDALLNNLSNAPPPDQVVQMEILQERTTPIGMNYKLSYIH